MVGSLGQLFKTRDPFGQFATMFGLQFKLHIVALHAFTSETLPYSVHYTSQNSFQRFNNFFLNVWHTGESKLYLIIYG